MPAKEQYGEKFCNDLISMRMGFSMPVGQRIRELWLY